MKSRNPVYCVSIEKQTMKSRLDGVPCGGRSWVSARPRRRSLGESEEPDMLGASAVGSGIGSASDIADRIGAAGYSPSFHDGALWFYRS